MRILGGHAFLTKLRSRRRSGRLGHSEFRKRHGLESSRLLDRTGPKVLSAIIATSICVRSTERTTIFTTIRQGRYSV